MLLSAHAVIFYELGSFGCFGGAGRRLGIPFLLRRRRPPQNGGTKGRHDPIVRDFATAFILAPKDLFERASPSSFIFFHGNFEGGTPRNQSVTSMGGCGKGG